MKQLLFVLLAALGMGANAAGLSLNDVLSEVPALDPSIPAPEAVTGVKVGERHWYHHEIVRYLNTLADASPRMVSLGEHAKSYGGRALVSYAISSPENLARLDEFKAARAAIIDPNADLELSEQPAVLHMVYSVHGNEASGANATPLVAYYLAATTSIELIFSN
ncbi:MAG: Uncharacterised protein [Halieaceae bacterium]|nr:MAG: Uncharacterised protein [Halieaceae bacterium]